MSLQAWSQSLVVSTLALRYESAGLFSIYNQMLSKMLKAIPYEQSFPSDTEISLSFELHIETIDNSDSIETLRATSKTWNDIELE